MQNPWLYFQILWSLKSWFWARISIFKKQPQWLYCRSFGDNILKTLKKCQNKHTTSENSQLEKQYSYSSRCAHLDVINLFSILLSLILEEKILFSLCTIFPYYVFFAWIETLMLTFKNSHILLWFIKNKGKL